jgi:hypothetical protein
MTTSLLRHQTYWPVTGAFTNFKIVVTGDIGDAAEDTLVVELVKNSGGSPVSCSSELKCTVTGGGGTELDCPLDTDLCSVTAGDLLAWKVYTGGTLSTAIYANWSVEFRTDAETANESALTMNATDALGVVTRYHSLQGTAPSSHSSSPSGGMTIAAIGGELTGFACELSAPPGSGMSRTFQVRDTCDGAAVALSEDLSCTISGDTDTGCTVDTDTPAFVEGGYYCIQSTQSGGAAAAYPTCGVKLTATNEGEFMFGGNTDTDPDSTSIWGPPYAVNTSLHTNATQPRASVQSPIDFTATDIYGWVYSAPGDGIGAHDIDLYNIDGAASSFGNCDIADTATECNQTGASVGIPAEEEFAILVTTTGSDPVDPGTLTWAVGATID